MATLEELNAGLKKNQPVTPVTLESLNAALSKNAALPKTEPEAPVEAGFGADILSSVGGALSDAASFIGDQPVPFFGRQKFELGEGEELGQLGEMEGLTMGDLPSLPGKALGDIGEFAGSLNTLLNPFADTQGVDESGQPVTIEGGGGPLDTAASLGKAAWKDPLAMLGEIGKVPIALASGDVGTVGSEIKENPLLTLLDIAPQAALAAGPAKASSLIKKIPELASRAKRSIVGKNVLGRASRAIAGQRSGIHSGPLEVIQNRAFRAKKEGLDALGKEAAGFDSVENIEDISRQVADEIYRKIPEAANAEWKKSMAGLSLKNADDPISFSDVRTRVFKSLREKHGIDAKGFAEGKTRLDWSSAHPEIRDNLPLQRQIEEIVAKVDGMGERYKGLRLSKDTAIKGKRKVQTGREKTYTAQQMHEELSSLRKSAFDRSGSVDLSQADRVANDILSVFRGELGKKLDGFNDLQRARSGVFKKTDAMIEAFGFRKRRQQFQPDVPDESTLSSRSRLEQLLSSKPTNEARRQTVQVFQEFVKDRFGKNIDIEKAVAELRVSTFDTQGISRAIVTGSPLALLGLSTGGPMGMILGELIGGMTIGNPKFNGGAFRMLGASEAVIDRIADGTKKLRQRARESMKLDIDELDTLTIAQMLNRNLEANGDILTTLGGNNGINQ